MNGNSFTHLELLTILSTLPDRVFILSDSGEFLEVFGGVDTNVRYTADSIVGLTLHDIMNRCKANEFLAKITETLDSQETQHYLYNFSPENFPTIPGVAIPETTQWYESRIQPLSVTIKAHKAVVWITRNVTENQERHDQLIELSELDDLTQLFNRRTFRKKIKQCFGCRQRKGINTSLILIDIDYFKHVNDSYGHPFGDEVIRRVASILKEEARATDSVARLGGEEFAIMLNMSDTDEAFQLAERIRQRIEDQVFSFYSKQAKITVSIGLSKITHKDRDQTDVFQRADSALYQAKSKGRNAVVVYSS